MPSLLVLDMILMWRSSLILWPWDSTVVKAQWKRQLGASYLGVSCDQLPCFFPEWWVLRRHCYPPNILYKYFQCFQLIIIAVIHRCTIFHQISFLDWNISKTCAKYFQMYTFMWLLSCKLAKRFFAATVRYLRCSIIKIQKSFALLSFQKY